MMSYEISSEQGFVNRTDDFAENHPSRSAFPYAEALDRIYVVVIWKIRFLERIQLAVDFSETSQCAAGPPSCVKE